MKKRKSNKGTPYERLICKTLSLWWSGGESDAIFWRTAGSGARATVRSKKGRKTPNQHGDVCAIDPVGEVFIKTFSLEIKRGYSKNTMMDLLDKREGAAEQEYEEWFKRLLLTQKSTSSLSWMLIVRRDKRLSLVFVPTTAMSELRLSSRRSMMNRSAEFTVELDGKSLFVSCVLFERFLDCVRPDDIRALYEKDRR